MSGNSFFRTGYVRSNAWRHCSSKDNPADIASRGTSQAILAESTWVSGPDWLKSYEEAMQISEETAKVKQAPVESLQEAKKEHRELASNLPCSSLLTGSSSLAVSAVIDCKRFSHLHRLLIITALVLRFTRKLKSKGEEPRFVPVDITAEDILEAEELWIRDIQIDLMSGAKFKNWEGELGGRIWSVSDPNGILRCGGRLGNADLSESQKHPALLDANHHVTSLIIRACHERDTD